MTQEIENFIMYMHEERHTSENTELSYERDLKKLCQFLAEQDMEDVEQISETMLNSYILYLGTDRAQGVHDLKRASHP